MTLITNALALGHFEQREFFLGGLKPRHGGVALDAVVFQKFHPFAHSVGDELLVGIDSNQKIPRENVARVCLGVFELAVVAIFDFFERQLLATVEFEDGMRMDAVKI